MAQRALSNETRPSRRTVATAALWSVPVIAVATAAPAMACSPATYDANFTSGTFTRSSATAGSGRATHVEADPVTYQVSVSIAGGKVPGGPNLTAAGDVNSGYNGVGDLGTDGLEFQQSGGSGGYGSRQSITFTFDRPVTNLSFVVADLDRKGSATSGSTVYHDAVAVTSSSGSVQVVNASGVTGTATQADPLRSRNVGEVNSSTTANRSTVSIAGPTTSFTVHFWSATGTDGQQIFLRDMVFTAAEDATCRV